MFKLVCNGIGISLFPLNRGLVLSACDNQIGGCPDFIGGIFFTAKRVAQQEDI